MATIAEDPVRFHSEDGGWAFLNPDSDDEAEKLEDAAESDFEPENDEEFNDNEEDDEDEEADVASDEDEFEDEEDDDEGEEWDALEAKARERNFYMLPLNTNINNRR
jgi:nucleosome binding factor SPN SPT16 subunit